MYTIDETVLNNLLKKKFSSLVGNTCETTEDIFKEDISPKASEELIKKAIKKFAWDSMREIKTQISLFSKGVNININLDRPISK